MTVEFIRSATLLLVLLNPFLLVIYLSDVIAKLGAYRFSVTLLRGSLIATIVFCVFALIGDAVFAKIIQAQFASFQIFGGVVFLLIGLQFLFQGPRSVTMLRGDSPNLAASIAVPVMIGPGTVSAAVVIGKRLDPLPACGAIVTGTFVSVTTIILLKMLHDYVRPRNEPIVERYIEFTGRIVALFIGTVSVDMIMQGTRTWAEKF